MPGPNLYRRSAECDCDGNAESLQDPAFLYFIHIPPMVDFENELFPKCFVPIVYTSADTVQNSVWQGAGNPPGRAICRDAVGTGKNGGHVSESLRGASHPIASDRATLEP